MNLDIPERKFVILRKESGLLSQAVYPLYLSLSKAEVQRLQIINPTPQPGRSEQSPKN